MLTSYWIELHVVGPLLVYLDIDVFILANAKDNTELKRHVDAYSTS